MFIDNKYYRWYLSITSSDDHQSFTERHHIIPKSLGGADTAGNLVKLSSRKHFLAHWLLTKCTTGSAKYKMLNALNCMRRNPRRRILSAWQYQIARAAARECQIGKVLTEDTRRKIGAAHKGKTISDEHRERVSTANKGNSYTRGRKLTLSHITKMSESKRGQVPSEETRKKISVSLIGNKRSLGRKASDETRSKMSAGHLNSNAQSNNKLGIKGVHRHQGRYRARVKIAGKYISIGMFDCPAAAHLAYLVTIDSHLRAP